LKFFEKFSLTSTYQVFTDELCVAPEEYSIVLTEAAFTPKKNKEKAAEIMFETFKVPALFEGIQPVLSLYASGRTIGLVLETGESVTRIVPIIDGYVMSHASQSFNISGRELTEYMMKLLSERGGNPSYSLTNTSPDREIVRHVKESLSYVALDYLREMKKTASSSFSEFEKKFCLPGGQVYSIGNERFRCPELMFNPIDSFTMGHKETCGIHEKMYQAIMKCEPDVRNDLYENIVIAGGNSLFPGFANRLYKELTALAPSSFRVRVEAPPNRRLSSWIGGSILGSLPSFQNFLLSKEEYEESGPSIVNQKFS